MRFCWIFCRKGGGGLTQSKRVLAENWAKYPKNRIFFGYFAENWVFFGHFFVMEGGGLAQSKIFLNRKFLGVQIDRGGGGLARSEKLKRKTDFFYASPKWSKITHFGGHGPGSTDFRVGWDPKCERYLLYQHVF